MDVSCRLFSCRLHDRNWDSILFFYLLFPDGYMTGILMQIPVGQDSWREIPVGRLIGLQVASVNRRPSGIESCRLTVGNKSVFLSSCS